tara:strand:+ start:1323 stop:2018 length:696 start_codon:yes stop_codon:yes gene_type:complete
MPQLIGKKFNLLFYFILFTFLSTVINKNIYDKKNFSRYKNKIEVMGLSDKNNLEVYNSLKFALSQNIFFLNKEDFLNILEENNLIEKFNIRKIYPNLIKIQIKQADILAVTNQNGKMFYIGSNGKLIQKNKIDNPKSNLPFVYGRDNYRDFIELKKNIDTSELKFEDIESFYYFPSNRWDIKTKDGYLIKLPEKNTLQSLKYANLIKNSDKLNNKKIIDLRINNNIILSNE